MKSGTSSWGDVSASAENVLPEALPEGLVALGTVFLLGGGADHGPASFAAEAVVRGQPYSGFVLTQHGFLLQVVGLHLWSRRQIFANNAFLRS